MKFISDLPETFSPSYPGFFFIFLESELAATRNFQAVNFGARSELAKLGKYSPLFRLTRSEVKFPARVDWHSTF